MNTQIFVGPPDSSLVTIEPNRLKVVHDAAVEYVKYVNKAFPGWQQRLHPSSRVDRDAPVQSFYALVATCAGKYVGQMSTPRAMFIVNMLERVSTDEEKRALAVFLNDHLSVVRNPRRSLWARR